MIRSHDVTGLVLAGGAGRRMSTDGAPVEKGLMTLTDRPLVARVIERLRPQVGALLVNANRALERYRAFGHPVVPDRLPGQMGPLAGIHAGLLSATTDWVAVVPCDSPFVRDDLVARLGAAVSAAGVRIAIARNRDVEEPVFMLLHRALTPSLEEALKDGRRSVKSWLERHECAHADFDDPSAFVNLNTRADLLAHTDDR